MWRISATLKRKVHLRNSYIYVYYGASYFLLLKTDIFPLFSSKDARLPEQLQRAMAAEAEASREARAKVGEDLCDHCIIVQV